jgi:hypothetical protein
VRRPFKIRFHTPQLHDYPGSLVHNADIEAAHIQLEKHLNGGTGRRMGIKLHNKLADHFNLQQRICRLLVSFMINAGSNQVPRNIVILKDTKDEFTLIVILNAVHFRNLFRDAIVPKNQVVYHVFAIKHDGWSV